MIKLNGSKRRELGLLSSCIDAVRPSSMIDCFSGTGAVSRLARNKGLYVTAIDNTSFSEAFGATALELSPDDIIDNEKAIDAVKRHVKAINEIEPVDGWFSDKYSKSVRFFLPENAKKIQAARDYVDEHLGSYKEDMLASILVTSIIEAADKVDNSSGLHTSINKGTATRAKNSIHFEAPALISAPAGVFINRDMKSGVDIEADLLYLDPPFNNASYTRSYHVWDTICEWDDPETVGKVQSPVRNKKKKSVWNSQVPSHQKYALDSIVNESIYESTLMSYRLGGILGVEEDILPTLQSKYRFVGCQKFIIDRDKRVLLGCEDRVEKYRHRYKNKPVVSLLIYGTDNAYVKRRLNNALEIR